MTSKLSLTSQILLVFHLSLSVPCLSFDNSGSVAERDVTQGAAKRHSGHTERVLSRGGVVRPMAHHFLEHFSEARGHEVVQDGVDR